MSDFSESRLAFIRLALVPEVGPVSVSRLLHVFGDAQHVFHATRDELLQVPDVGPKRASSIQAARQMPLDEMLDECERFGIQIITPLDSNYPEPLRNIPDPPCVLFMRGTLRPEDSLALAMVGTRHPSLYGRQMATRLAEGFAHSGLTVVSGLARGVDGYSHEGALAAGGRTLAVLGSGLLEIYPPEHVQLAERIVERGALLSESPPHAKPLAESFPRRNRIVSGLSLGVVVVEAGDRSGTMITARHAAEQGREVFAVPGRLTDRTAHGTLRLIRDGASVVLGVETVLEELGPLIAPITQKLTSFNTNDPRVSDLDEEGTSKTASNDTSSSEFFTEKPLGNAMDHDTSQDERNTTAHTPKRAGRKKEGTKNTEKTGKTPTQRPLFTDRSSSDSLPSNLPARVEAVTIRRPAELLINDVERLVLATIGDGDAVQVDAIIRQSGLTSQQVLTALAVLEMRHLIRRRGTLVARA